MAGNRWRHRRFMPWVPSLALVLLGLSAWWVTAFLHRAEARINTLPARVDASVAARGGRYIPLAAVSPNVVNATIAVEDRSFWSNPGISPEGLFRAALVDVASRAWVEGGSTITQQLVRDEFLGYQKRLRRKAVEIAYALLAARRWPKAEIMALYLNEVNYGHGAFGVGAASALYFHRAPSDLDLAEAALLAGIPQDPMGLDPIAHPAAARQRQAVVLQAMVATGDITPSQARVAAQEPVTAGV